MLAPYFRLKCTTFNINLYRDKTSNFIARRKLVLRCSWQFNSFAKYFLTTRSSVVINYKLHFVYRERCLKLELRMPHDKETRAWGQKGK